MVPIEEAEQRLAAVLAELGFDPNNPDVDLAVRAFRRFAGMPVDTSDDALLFQTGVFAFTGEPEFHLDFTRQFVVEVDGEYDGMQQLHLTFFYPPSPELAAVRTTLWASDCESLDDFFERADSVRRAVAGLAPIRFELMQEEV